MSSVTHPSLQALLDAYTHRTGGDAVTGVVDVVLASTAEAQTRTGNTYDKLTLADGTMSASAVKDFDRRARGFGPSVRVTMTVDTYAGKPSYKLEQIEQIDADPMLLMCPDPQAVTDARAELADVMAAMAPGPYRSIVHALLEPVIGEFGVWPAARRMHHAYVGGLVLHTMEVLRFARGLAALDADPCDGELLTAACLLHDLGKLDEYAAPPKLELSLAGRLAGHLPFGALRLGMAVAERRGAGEEIPDACVWALMHCLEQSHGAHRPDTTIPCATKEARCLSAADEMSAARARGGNGVDVEGDLRALARTQSVAALPNTVASTDVPF